MPNKSAYAKRAATTAKRESSLAAFIIAINRARRKSKRQGVGGGYPGRGSDPHCINVEGAKRDIACAKVERNEV